MCFFAFSSKILPRDIVLERFSKYLVLFYGFKKKGTDFLGNDRSLLPKCIISPYSSVVSATLRWNDTNRHGKFCIKSQKISFNAKLLHSSREII